MSTTCTKNEPRGFHHDPYGTPLLDQGSEERKNNAALNFFTAATYADEHQKQEQYSLTNFDTLSSVDQMTSTEGEGGISDNGTVESSGPFVVTPVPQPTSTVALAMASSTVIAAAASVVRYASVDFRFGSAWFVAPFRTSVGEIVVVEYPHNGSLHVGLVSCITTTIPPTFTTLRAAEQAGLMPTEEDLMQYPRLVRHAREFDRHTKLELRTHDLASLRSARELAEEMGAPITFIDAEWLLDLTAVTFLVQVWGNMEQVDRLADELAAREGAEVVFTYPAVRYE
ncbi:uncharacterized protein TEOVI_000580100 [Trypanosoma equiperdum]|nr:hypothetical protein, conserved [Trypanosoma brucei gambiense DAL972]RHW68195.1 hypothetical protein DPX39_110085300 [Trypanosoma brucei equiperdum]CBH18106.1 hypothetical protein, conserved [Trypanosoma brucei gambiense DAL972]SCU68820.1 hypothetical protein, conserved [Trypanosoma equiperdum]|eukprot:XP_011780370.1 hypothetical protein, conserved [Trypanosoma brucei gambiense DAL972]